MSCLGKFMSIILQHSMPHLCLCNYVISHAALEYSQDVQHSSRWLPVEQHGLSFPVLDILNLVYWRPSKIPLIGRELFIWAHLEIVKEYMYTKSQFDTFPLLDTPHPGRNFAIGCQLSNIVHIMVIFFYLFIFFFFFYLFFFFFFF